MKKLFIARRERDIVRYSEKSDQKDAFEVSEASFIRMMKEKYPSVTDEKVQSFLDGVKRNPFNDWIQW